MGFLDEARCKVADNAFRLSQHAQEEAAADEISVEDIRVAILGGAELEPYPDDPRGASCLFVGCDRRSRWLHVLCGRFDQPWMVVITVYLPRMPKWKDPWTRNRK